jgi:MoaA/NifB/PqqE/SkfB family radical SAM enzyme
VVKALKPIPIATRTVSFLSNRPGPYFLGMDITMRCNCRCDFCNVWRNLQNQEEVEKESASQILMERRLKEAWEMGCRAVNFSGGEPLLYKNLGRLVTIANDLGYYIMVISNGITLTKLEPWMRKIDSLALSFTAGREAYERTRGLPVYNLVKENIEKSIEYGLKVVLFDTISVETLPHIDETAKFAREHGVKLHIFSVTEQPRMGFEVVNWTSQRPVNVYSEMERAKRKWGGTIMFWRDGEARLAGIVKNPGFRCRIAETTVTVKPDASVVLPCSAFPEFKSNSEETLIDFWNGSHGVFARQNCGKMSYCAGCAHQFCTYHASLIGQPYSTLQWLFNSL